MEQEYDRYHFEAEGKDTSRRRLIRKEGPEYSDNNGVYAELLKLRTMVAERGGTPLPSGKASIDGNIMSTVFAVVLVLILSVSVYAFINLYRALYKRFTATS